jgi:hypothetical protein
VSVISDPVAVRTVRNIVRANRYGGDDDYFVAANIAANCFLMDEPAK